MATRTHSFKFLLSHKGSVNLSQIFLLYDNIASFLIVIADYSLLLLVD
jgi:hypothetical protein